MLGTQQEHNGIVALTDVPSDLERVVMAWLSLPASMTQVVLDMMDILARKF